MTRREHHGRPAKTAVALALLVVTTSVLTGPIAKAGDRPNNVVFVNMTPDESSTPASRKCVKQFEQLVKKEYVELLRIGETKARNNAGMTSGQPFLEWPSIAAVGAELTHPEGYEFFPDSVILIDCRPDEQRLDLRMERGVMIQLRDTKVDLTALKLVMSVVKTHMWHLFNP